MVAEATRRLVGAFASKLVTVRRTGSPAKTGPGEASSASGCVGRAGATVVSGDELGGGVPAVDGVAEPVAAVDARGVGIVLRHPDAISATTARPDTVRLGTERLPTRL